MIDCNSMRGGPFDLRKGVDDLKNISSKHKYIGVLVPLTKKEAFLVSQRKGCYTEKIIS